MGPAQFFKTQKMCNLAQMIESPELLLSSVGIGRHDPWQAWTSVGNGIFGVVLELRFDLIRGALKMSKYMEVKPNYGSSSDGKKGWLTRSRILLAVSSPTTLARMG